MCSYRLHSCCCYCCMFASLAVMFFMFAVTCLHPSQFCFLLLQASCASIDYAFSDSPPSFAQFLGVASFRRCFAIYFAALYLHVSVARTNVFTFMVMRPHRFQHRFSIVICLVLSNRSSASMKLARMSACYSFRKSAT